MNPSYFPCGRPVAAVLTSLALAACASAEDVNLKWQASDANEKLSGYSPQRIELTNVQPASLKKAPGDLAAPLYGELKLGPKGAEGTTLIIVDEPDGKPSRLFVDANSNGDLSDDPAPTWTPNPSPDFNGKVLTTYIGNAKVKIPYAGGPKEARLIIYRFDKTDPRRAALTNFLFYYRDYALSGDVKLGDKSYTAMLVDEMTTGDFRGAEGKASGVRLLIDVNGDGKFDSNREGFDSRSPFNIAGTTYEVSGMTPAGSFQIVKSKEAVEEIPPAPNLANGAKAVPFTAKTTAGKQVKFPDDYKGKVVLLDFWATWCPPCIAEVPNVVANYEKYHEKGFEILGVSLDRTNAEETVATFTKEKKMTWPQIYDGKWWQAQVGQTYAIESIPSAFLVDGDTGTILGSGMECREESLGPAIEKALAGKKGSKGSGN